MTDSDTKVVIKEVVVDYRRLKGQTHIANYIPSKMFVLLHQILEAKNLRKHATLAEIIKDWTNWKLTQNVAIPKQTERRKRRKVGGKTVNFWLDNTDYCQFKSLVGLHSLKIADALSEAVNNWIKKQLEENDNDLESLFKKSESIPELIEYQEKELVNR